MEKSLSQISFDFSLEDEKGIPSAEAAKEAAEGQTEPIENLAETIKIKSVEKKSTRGRPSLKEIERTADLIQIPPDEILFEKQYYSIGKVAEWFNCNQSLIRYWETEFDILEPRKNRKGDRFFRPVDVKNLVLIHDLLRCRKFTIQGAKDYLKKNKKAEDSFALIQSLEKLKTFLNELKASL